MRPSGLRHRALCSSETTVRAPDNTRCQPTNQYKKVNILLSELFRKENLIMTSEYRQCSSRLLALRVFLLVLRLACLRKCGQFEKTETETE